MGQEKGASPVGQFHSANAHWAVSNRLCAKSCKAVTHNLHCTFPQGTESLLKAGVTRTALKETMCSSFAHGQATLKCIYLGMHLWWRHHARSAVPPSSWQPKVTPSPPAGTLVWALARGETSQAPKKKMLFPPSLCKLCLFLTQVKQGLGNRVFGWGWDILITHIVAWRVKSTDHFT